MNKLKRYEALAFDITESIRSGVLQLGDRLPSIRECSESRGVSPSTVFQAYYQLEAEGLIRARDRSGYFVAICGESEVPQRAAAEQKAETASRNAGGRISKFLAASSKGGLVPFGSAFPSPLLFPLSRLGQIFAAGVQKLDPWSTVIDIELGSERLRRQIARRYLTEGVSVHFDEVIITSGALEALNLCLSAVTRPGDCVIVEAPTFYAALHALDRLGLKAIAVPTEAGSGIDLCALESAIKRHRPSACWLMTTFQNPIGSLMPNDKKRSLVELLTRYQIPLIEDDVYAELYYGSVRPMPAKAFDTEGIVLHCSSFSKCLAPGYRVGWTTPGRFCEDVARLKFMTSLTTALPAQEAIATYLEKGGYDKHLRRLRQTLNANQTRFLKAINEHFPQDTRVTRPDGGYFLWVTLPESVDAVHVHQKALAAGITSAPGPLFSSNGKFKHCLRLNYGHMWDSDAEAGLDELGRLARSG